MTAFSPTRRDALKALAATPLLLSAKAPAGLAEDFSAGLARNPWMLAFASARSAEFAAPLSSLTGRLPRELKGELWRNGPAEHERFGHRYSHWFDGNGWEERDGTIRLDLCQAPDARFLVRDLRAVMRGEWDFPSGVPRYRRLELGRNGIARIEDAAAGTADSRCVL